MAPFPLALDQLLGHWPAYIVYLLIGIAFGAVLEIAGFGRSTKLAAQFYFKEMTVLKVMFTGIVVAMLFIFLTTGLGLLDYNLIWVNPTYLWPGIVGGLIMGVGFIIGGFCPGTSLVAVATGKLDGMFFTLGAFFGIFVFGESVGLFENFYNSSYMGRFTIPDLLQTSTGMVVLLIVIMALGAFMFAEQMERIFGKANGIKFPGWRRGVAGAGVAFALVVFAVGQPTNTDRWAKIAPEKEKLLNERAVQITPAELLSVSHDPKIKVVMLDVRSEADYNLFHVQDAQNVAPADVLGLAPTLQQNPANTVVVLMSNDEAAATQAWKTLVAESVLNLYILEGGVNNWLTTFADADFKAQHSLNTASGDKLCYVFDVALGARYPAADPNPDVFQIKFEPKVKLGIKRGATSGGCG